MCLSTVYTVISGQESKLCEYICSIKLEDDVITLTDVTGVETTVKGSLKSLDLVKGRVIIEGSVL